MSLVEGLSSNRRVIASDINPIASLIQHAEVAEVPAERINAITSAYAEEIQEKIGNWFLTTCRKCEIETRYRWIERAYFVKCPVCAATAGLDEDAKAKRENGKPINGEYVCVACNQNFKSVSAKRLGSTILKVRYKCAHCGFDDLSSPRESDINKAMEIEALEGEFLKSAAIQLPEEKFPMNWDRQSEDALARKGFTRFIDLFTPRNRVFMAMLFGQHALGLNALGAEEKVAVLTQISALLRYVNTMTFSTSSWMDGRPVAWAKHAYWTPNQFIEVNPFEYLEHRQLATTRWESDRKSRFKGKRPGSKPSEVIKGTAEYSIFCGDSRRLEVPAKSIDAVITDPPFGSNVQYGELTHFWEVWLKNLNPYSRKLFELEPEILIHRKRSDEGKNASSYESGLHEVFLECHRVLKDDGSLVFTFNNKSPEAWFAVMHAAIRAGFYLPEQGTHYLEEIKAYRDTSHLRFSGELQGDVLYTFKKRTTSVQSPNRNPHPTGSEFAALFRRQADLGTASNQTELAVNLQLAIIHQAAKSIEAGGGFEDAAKWLNLLRVAGNANRTGRPILDELTEAVSEDG